MSLKKLKSIYKDIENRKEYRNPLVFGIVRVDKNGTFSYEKINYKSNFLSAAALIFALEKSKIFIDFKKSEFISNLDKNIIRRALLAFGNLKKEAKGDSHLNLQILLNIDEELKLDSQDEFKVVFIFDNKDIKSPEGLFLKNELVL